MKEQPGLEAMNEKSVARGRFDFQDDWGAIKCSVEKNPYGGAGTSTESTTGEQDPVSKGREGVSDTRFMQRKKKRSVDGQLRSFLVQVGDALMAILRYYQRSKNGEGGKGPSVRLGESQKKKNEHFPKIDGPGGKR